MPYFACDGNKTNVKNIRVHLLKIEKAIFALHMFLNKKMLRSACRPLPGSFCHPLGGLSAYCICCGFLVSQGGHFPQHSRQHLWHHKNRNDKETIPNITCFCFFLPMHRMSPGNLKGKPFARHKAVRSNSMRIY